MGSSESLRGSLFYSVLPDNVPWLMVQYTSYAGKMVSIAELCFGM